MKSSPKSVRALLVAFATLGVALTTSQAQSVTTAPVGAMSYSIPANSTASLGFPLLRPGIATGVVSAGDAGTVTLNGASLTSLLVAGSPYFLEVVGHSDGVTQDNVGDRFELNEASTTGSVVAIDTTSSLNTSAGSFSGLVGYKVAIRPHWTLASLFGTGVSATALNSSTTFSGADQVLAWTGTSWSTFWFRQNAAGTVKEWRNTLTNTTNQDAAIVPPGVGVFFKRQSGNLDMSLVGDVRTNKFVRLLDSTTQLVAQGFPIDRSPNALVFNNSNGFVSGTTFSSADQLLTWTGNSYSTYWYRQNSSGTVREWRNTLTNTTNQSDASFINASQAIFVKPLPTSNPNDVEQVVPFTL